MQIRRCRTNHMKNPLGFSMDHAVVSWVTESGCSKRQQSARIKVALDADMKNLVFDSGQSCELKSTGTELPLDLKPRTCYYWIVEVEGDADSAVSEVNWFETGKRDEPWVAEWITTPWEDKNLHPYFRKDFNVNDSKKISHARLYVTGAGIYELELNGQRVGNEYLSPGCNAMDSWVQVQTFDVTEHLKSGRNMIGALIGNGWSKGPFGVFGDIQKPYADEYLLLAELRVLYDDASEDIFATDTSWQCAPSPVLFDSIYDGEIFDARRIIHGWSSPDTHDAQGWEHVVAAHPERLGILCDRLSLPILIKEVIKPVGIIHTPKDEYVLDLGQVITGWLRFTVSEPDGTKLHLSYGEIMQNNCFYQANLRGAKAEYTFISDGNEHIVQPHFTFYGFRYVKLEGFTELPAIESFEGCAVYSDLEETGQIKTSDPLVNKLFENAKWSQKDNFLDVPTDCPQRDERMGWTGDAQVFCKTACLNMDTYAFYTKFLHDLWQEQKSQDGMSPNVVPSVLNKEGRAWVGHHAYGGAAAWGDAATVMPWTMFEHYGDVEILKRQYPSMKAWVDWIYRHDESTGGKRLWTDNFQYGDWLALDGPVPGGTQGGTDEVLVASAYYKYSSELTAKAAAVLGKDEDAAYYKKLSEEVRSSIQDEFYTKSGRSGIPTQTAHVLALMFDLVDEEVKERTAKGLVALLENKKMHLTTGFVGTPLLCRALSKYGYSNAAFRLLLQEDYPGWLYEIKMGATTIWERWNSVLPNGRLSGTDMNSMNHYAYGSIVQWMYENLCGIRQLEPGYKRFIIAPETNDRIFGASASFESPYGLIKSCWEVEDDIMKVKVRIPFGTTALLKLPLSDAPGQELVSGEYEFEYPLAQPYRSGYSFDYSLDELRANPDTSDAVQELASLIDQIPDDLGQDTSASLAKMLEDMESAIKEPLSKKINFEELEKTLNKIMPSYRHEKIR